jgi:Xaa-Pro aminopeptidase
LTTATDARVARASRLVPVLRERELDCLLVSNLVNVRYLTGFTGTNGACVVSGEQRLFLTDFRYVEQAEEQVGGGFEVVRGGRDLLADLAARLTGRAGFDDAHLSVRAHQRLAEGVEAGVELVPAGGLVERLREVKDDDELRTIADAATLADGIYEYLRGRGMVGRTELEVARDLEAEMRNRGSEPAFPVIVAAGPHGARPHAEPREVEIPPDTLVIVDLGCRLDGYCSDCTRTLATGRPPAEALEVYELVLTAQERALDAVHAGVSYQDADAAARELIEAAGHGERFGHGLGHGVGLEVHEGPRLARNSEGELAAGNVVTVEPGIYVPGEIGVRIEDLVVVTEDGRRVLSRFPKSLLTIE